MDEVGLCIPKQAIQWEVPGFKRGPGRPWINWRDIVNKDIQRMGLTWEEVEASDRLGVSVWPYASAMLDESSQKVKVKVIV